MKRWPFWCSGLLLLTMNMYRLGNDVGLRVWNDPTCAALFVGYMICVSIALAIKK